MVKNQEKRFHDEIKIIVQRYQRLRQEFKILNKAQSDLLKLMGYDGNTEAEWVLELNKIFKQESAQKKVEHYIFI